MRQSYAVLDAGVLLTTVQTERYTPQAQQLVAQLADTGIQLVAPVLISYELMAVVRKWVYRKIVTAEQAQNIVEVLFRYPVLTVFDGQLLQRGYELATHYGFPTAYDAQYLAVAEHYRATFWTADQRLFQQISPSFPGAAWIGDFQPSQG